MFFALVALNACDRSPPRRPATDDPPTSSAGLAKLARALGVDAEVLGDPSPPPLAPAPPGDLAAEVAGFTTVDACVKEHATKDPLVSDALGALGYDSFLGDACRTLEAAHARSAKPCSLIDASGLRRECRSTLAMVTAGADACPLRVDDAPALGRDPTCLAVASGDARLCAGEARERRARCEALALRDGSHCGSSTACQRDVARWRSALPAKVPTPPPFKVSGHATMSSADAGVDAGGTVVDLARVAAAGVVRLKGPSSVSYRVGPTHESGAAPVAPSPEMGARVAFRVVVTKDDKATLDHAEIDLPGRAALVVPPLRFEGTVGVTRAEKRGDAITITVRGLVVATPRSYAVDAEVHTFILDGIDQDQDF